MIPLKNNILFKPLPSEEYSEGGLYIPETARKPNDKGIVIKVGIGSKNKPMTLKEGMIVHRVRSWGQEIMIDNELYYLMDAGAILAIE